MTGFTQEQVLGNTLTEVGFIAPSVRETLVKLFERDGHARELELDLHRADGSSMTALYSGVVVEVDGTNRILSTAVDITERKRAEHKLAHAYDLLERSNEAARIGSWEIDLATMEIDWSRVACEIFGLAPDAKVAVNDWLNFYVSASGAPCAECPVSESLSEGRAFDCESIVRTAAGEERFVRTNGLPVMEEGRCVRMYGLFQDLTERHRSEIALQRQHRAIDLTKNMTTVFLTSSPDNVFTDLLDVVKKATESHFGLFGYIDGDGNLACPALSQLLWGSSEYADGKAVFRPEQWGGIWGEALRDSTTCLVNEKLQVPEGHLNLDNAIATPLIHQGRAIGLFVLANRVGGYGADEVDLLESAALQTAPVLNAYLERIRKEDEHERLEAQFRQSQKMEAIGQLTGGVAHDFNNLLQVIIGYSDILLLHDITPEQSRDLLEQIASAGHRAARLVSQLLLFSRRQIMRPETLSLNETTADLMKMLGRIIGEQVQIRWHPASHLSYIFADRSMIEQALTNLCVNARDAMPDGGIVTIETREVTLSAEDCASNPEAQPGDYVLLSVNDTGCGMGEETLLHIFEPFFTTKAVGKGTGLGLATVYGIVKQHNGVIDVQSQPGEGTTFKLYWPVQPEGQRTPAIDVVEEPVAGGNETVLLAEDDEAVRVMVRQILEGAGYTVVTAVDGTDALAVLKDYPGRVDLVILDVVMPNMGGHEAYQRMQAEYPALKAFFASGYSEDAIHKNFVLDKGLTLIQKPYTQRDLLKTIREVLNQN
jgi:signal transduction histidine kinase/PAS domain-containing protein/ActR/RegA family two-component response regulator